MFSSWRRTLYKVMDDDREVDYPECISAESKTLANAIVTNNINVLKDLLKHTNVNTPLNNRHETALILAVKLTHIEMVEALLNTPNCDKNYVNINSCSPLDLALVTAFDNRLEPRHSICWQIIGLLLENRADPVCKDAMMYVIRTALKCEEHAFIFRVIDTCIAQATSVPFHDLLLQKIHRHQPMCASIIDPFLEKVSTFTVKLLKMSCGHKLSTIVNSFEYYAESHWACRDAKAAVFQKLILYSTGAGWDFTNTDINVLKKICRKTALWCIRHQKNPPSLLHLSRVSFRKTVMYPVNNALITLQLPKSIKNYILMSDVDSFYACQNADMDNFMF